VRAALGAVLRVRKNPSFTSLVRVDALRTRECDGGVVVAVAVVIVVVIVASTPSIVQHR